MASELRVNTIKDANGNNSIATSFVAGGSAKHWTQIVQSNASVNDSFNQSSATDEGTGDTSWDFTSAMGNDDYCSNLNCNSGSYHFIQSYNDAQKTTAGDRSYTMETDGTSSVADASTIFISTHGDLA